MTLMRCGTPYVMLRLPCLAGCGMTFPPFSFGVCGGCGIPVVDTFNLVCSPCYARDFF